jgi:hypothetical protein
MEPNTESSLFELQIDHNVTAYLKEAARWAKFLAILGFIGCGLMILMALFFGTIVTAMLNMGGNMMGGAGSAATGIMGGLLSFIYIVVALLLFLPCLYLYNFGSKMQVALRTNDQEQLTRSFKNLKAHYRYIGIFALIYLGLIALVMIFGVLGSLGRH